MKIMINRNVYTTSQVLMTCKVMQIRAANKFNDKVVNLLITIIIFIIIYKSNSQLDTLKVF